MEGVTKRLFVENEKRWGELCALDHKIQEKANVTVISNGIALPIKRVKPEGVLDYLCEGGIVDENQNFVAGWLRKINDPKMNKSCHKAYKVNKEEIVKESGKVVFGGILDEHFGHFMSESMSRLWWVIQNPEEYDRIVFLPDKEEKSWYYGFFDLIEIPREKILIPQVPTQFDEVIIPDETMFLWTGYKEEVNTIYNKIVENAPKCNYDKVYLTRGELSKQDCVGEDFFVEYYRNHGYEIVAPEVLPIMEQVSCVAGAKEIACTGGTLSHFIMFTKKNTKITILNRTTDHFLEPQIVLNQAREADYYFVDISKNYLPVKHSRGCFLLEPTVFWNDFLVSQGEEPTNITESERNANAYEYLQTWRRIYTRPAAMETIRDFDMCDLLNRLGKVEGEPDVVRKTYGMQERRSKLKKERDQYKMECSKLEEAISMTGEDAGQILGYVEENKKLTQELSKLKTRCDLLDNELEQMKKPLKGKIKSCILRVQNRKKKH